MNVEARETVRDAERGTVTAERMIRIARYSAYPRVTNEHAVQTGFTRQDGGDLLRIVTAGPEAVGSLLRVRIQDLDARDACDTLARVVDCQRSGEGRFELTLDTLDAHRPRFVRRAGGTRLRSG